MVDGTRITDDELLSWAEGGFIIKKKINHDTFLPNPGMFTVRCRLCRSEMQNNAWIECTRIE